jgi:hypothetical protein
MLQTIILFRCLRVKILVGCGIFATIGRAVWGRLVSLLDGVSSLDFGPASQRGLFYWAIRTDRGRAFRSVSRALLV